MWHVVHSASSGSHLVLFPLAEMVTELSAGKSPQIVGPMLLPLQAYSPEKAQIALCPTEASLHQLNFILTNPVLDNLRVGWC